MKNDILGESKCNKCGNIEKWYYREPLKNNELPIPLRAVPPNRQELDTSKSLVGGDLVCSKCKKHIHVDKIH